MNVENYSIEELASEESFISYCLGESPEEVRYWTDWVSGNPAKKSKVEAAKELVALFSLRLPESEYLEEKNKILLALEQRENGNDSEFNSQKNNYWNYIGKIAAILIIGVLIGISVQQFLPSSKQVNPVAVSHKIVKENPSGQKSTVFLSDGTKVVLNSESRIEFDKKFDDGKRGVSLVGEAFFDVAKDESRPFIVRAGDINTTALGTSFNVQAYGAGQHVKVSLVTGKVKVENAKSVAPGLGTILLPGDEAVYSYQTDSINKSVFDRKDVLAWKDGILFFHDDTFEEIKAVLERWYGVDIEVLNKKNSIDTHYSGEFDNQSLETVLKAISFSKHFDFKIKDKKVIVDFIAN